jgi:hypothetical protein
MFFMDSASPGHVRKRAWFAWEPTLDTVVAVITVILWTGAYYLQVHLRDEPVHTIVGFAATVAIVAGPLWWLCWHRGRPLADLGITTRRWKKSLAIGTVIGAIFLWIVVAHYGGLGAGALVPHLIANALGFWEPFFVFGWLGLQFGRAFGIVPGVVLAGASQGLYHVGTYPAAMVVVLALFGILFCAVFRLTDNLLVLWPIAWASTCAMGTLVGGYVFSWYDILVCGAAFALQLAVVAWTWRRQQAALPGAARPLDRE